MRRILRRMLGRKEYRSRLASRMLLVGELRACAGRAADRGLHYDAYRLHALADAAEALLCGDRAGAYEALSWAVHYRDVTRMPARASA